MLPYRFAVANGLGEVTSRADLLSDGPLASLLNTQAWMGIRPEHICIRQEGTGLKGVIEFLENLGDAVVVYVRVEGLDELVRVKSRLDLQLPHKGQEVVMTLDAGQPMVFHPDGQRFY